MTSGRTAPTEPQATFLIVCLNVSLDFQGHLWDFGAQLQPRIWYLSPFNTCDNPGLYVLALIPFQV